MLRSRAGHLSCALPHATTAIELCLQTLEHWHILGSSGANGSSCRWPSQQYLHHCSQHTPVLQDVKLLKPMGSAAEPTTSF